MRHLYILATICRAYLGVILVKSFLTIASIRNTFKDNHLLYVWSQESIKERKKKLLGHVWFPKNLRENARGRKSKGKVEGNKK